MMNEFVDAMRSKGMPAFKRRYREVDVLLVDDIQFLERTEQLQEEFFYTFNDLHGRGSQIVISSDRPPKSIATIEDRLRSRFEWGLITDRQIGMYVFRELTDYSYPKIAEEFGGRDHTTVMHACEKIRTQMAEKRVVFEQVNDLISRIKHGASG